MASFSSKKAASTRARRRISHYHPKCQLFFIWAILILTHLPSSSCHHHNHRRSISSSRKDMFFKTTQPQFHAAVSASSQPLLGASGQEGNIVFDEDKRIIHTVYSSELELMVAKLLAFSAMILQSRNGEEGQIKEFTVLVSIGGVFYGWKELLVPSETIWQRIYCVVP